MMSNLKGAVFSEECAVKSLSHLNRRTRMKSVNTRIGIAVKRVVLELDKMSEI